MRVIILFRKFAFTPTFQIKTYGHTVHTFSRLMLNVVIWEIYFYTQWISDDW